MKNLFSLLVVACFSFATFSGLHAQDFDPNTYYRLTTQWQGDDKALDIINDDKDITPILAKKGNYTGQKWKLTKVGENTYTLSTKFQGEKKVLDCIQGPNQHRPVLNESKYSGSNWKIVPIRDGYYRISNVWLSDLSLDVINDGKNDKIQAAPSGNYTGQMWKITPIEMILTAAPDPTSKTPDTLTKKPKPTFGPNAYVVRNQWGSTNSDWNPGGKWTIGGRANQRVVAVKLTSEDGGKTLTGTMTYAGEGPVKVKASQIKANKYKVENRWGSDPSWHDGGTWRIGGRAAQRVVSLDISSKDEGKNLTEMMTYSSEGPIRFKARKR